jgi:spore germination protein
MDTLKYLQQVGSDPIGIGEKVRAKYYSYWQGVDWKDIYKDIDINVDVKVDIKQYGAID